MKVKRLIEILKLMDPEAECYAECSDSNVIKEVGQFESKVHAPYPVPVVYIGDCLTKIREDTHRGDYYVEEISYYECQDLGKKRIIL